MYIILSVFRLPTTYGVTNASPVGRIRNTHPAYWWMRSAYPPYIAIALRHRRDRSRPVPTVIVVTALKLSHLYAWSKTALAVLKCNS